MIGRLTGRVVERQPPAMVLDVGGVGYELQAPVSTFAELPAADATVTLHTHLIVREDAQLLYGFVARAERDLFRELLKVSGVGARIALTILSGMDGGTLRSLVASGDAAQLARLPGIGRKTAERLVVDLRDRLDSAAPARLAFPGATAPPPSSDPADEAVHALVALGLKPAEASRRATLAAEPGLAAEDIVRLALQGMDKPGAAKRAKSKA